MILDPEEPNGCPKETAPPNTFTLAGSNFIVFIFANDTTEKASLISKKSTSEIESPAF